MAVRKVVYYPDDPLTRKAAPVDRFDARLTTLVDDMFETMHAHEGVGLAAPQIGVSSRLFVLQEPDGEPMAFVNPELSDLEGREEGEEGCLSMPGLYAMVPRATRLRVRAMSPEGDPFELEATDFLARIIQHEYDHVDGVLFPERVDIITRQELLSEWTRLRENLLSGQPSGHAAQ